MPPRALAIEVATEGSVGSVKRVELELLLRQAQEVNRVFRYWPFSNSVYHLEFFVSPVVTYGHIC
jgi:hypothetical protein